MKKIAIGLTVIVGLSGCAGMNYALKHYTGVEVQQFSYQEAAYRIFDKPEENRLMITPGYGEAVAAGAVQGATLGLSGPMGGPQGKYQIVTQAYLDQTRTGCKVTSGGLVVQPQWEFFYKC